MLDICDTISQNSYSFENERRISLKKEGMLVDLKVLMQAILTLATINLQKWKLDMARAMSSLII